MQAALDTLKEQNNEAVKVRIGAIKTELDVLDKSITQWNTKALAASAKTAEYQRLKESLDQTGSSYDKLRNSIDQLTVGNKSPSTMQPWRNATAPVKVDPGVAKHLLIGLFLGLAVGIGSLVVLDKADDRFASSTEVMEHFNEVIMG